jgi:ribose-phosphate pyrophosphokinase
VESGTIEQTLPGLEAEVPRVEMTTGHAIPLTPQKRLMVFAGRSHPELAAKIAEQLGVELGEIELTTFANGETYCRYCESVRGADVFIVQTGSRPVDQNIMELLFMIQAARLASAKRITAVVPWFPYSRQDRKAKPREPISSRLLADMIQKAGADRLLTMDLHAGQVQGFFTIPVDHMTALPLFAQHFRDLGLTGDGVVSVAPDAGRAKHAVRFAEMIDADFAIMNKTRPSRDVASVTEITGRVAGKIAIVGDDNISTGHTLLQGAQALEEAGAEQVWVFATHGLFADDALERFGKAGLAGIVVTDTVPVDPLRRPERMTVLTISGLLAETIMNVFADESVSAIFGGENQLF